MKEKERENYKVRITFSTNSSSTQAFLIPETVSNTEVDLFYLDGTLWKGEKFLNLHSAKTAHEVFENKGFGGLYIHSKRPEHKFYIFLLMFLYNLLRMKELYEGDYVLVDEDRYEEFSSVVLSSEENIEKFFQEKSKKILGRFLNFAKIKEFIEDEILNVSHSNIFYGNLTNDLPTLVIFSVPLNREDLSLNFDALEFQFNYFVFNGKKFAFKLEGEEYAYSIFKPRIKEYKNFEKEMAQKEKFFVDIPEFTYVAFRENSLTIYSPKGGMFVIFEDFERWKKIQEEGGEQP